MVLVGEEETLRPARRALSLSLKFELDKFAPIFYAGDMHTQNQVKRTLSQPAALKRVRQLLTAHGEWNRTQLADHVCDEFGFHDLRGKRQRSGCLKALRRLADAGLVALPAPKRGSKGHGVYEPRRLERPVPPPVGVPERVDDIAELELILADSKEQIRLWNELMLSEHPLGHRRLVGRQMRYLAGSEHGWLGAVGFAAAALNLHDRDHWIGWDHTTKDAHLDGIVGLSRFLIRPSVSCQNLASRVLGLCCQRFAADFKARYNYRPWLLETFVDTTQFTGACFRAANWVRVGRTQGRGRQDRLREAPETVKDIYVYPLVANFRQRLGLAPDAGWTPLTPEQGLEGEEWAENEFGGAPLGDQRCTQRLVMIAHTKGQHPGCSWTEAVNGDKAAVKGYYRFIESPEDSAVTMENILLPHRERTKRRMADQSRVLCIQDTTDLDFATLVNCLGLGVIGKNQTSTESKGLRLHSTFTVSARGLPLGLLRAPCYARELKPEHRGRDLRYLPLEEKETYRWVEGLRDCQTVAHELPRTQLVCVMDREGDFFELFAAWHEDAVVDVLVRAQHDRRTESELSLFEEVTRTPVRTSMQVNIQRLSARPKSGGRAARPARPARRAHLLVRYTPVEVLPPKHGVNAGKAPVPVWLIHVREKNPPQGQKRIEWFLLTTLSLESPQQAVQCVEWYCQRWRIEDWHKVIKSVCRTEKAAHRTAERLKRTIAIDLVVAWRLLLLTLAARELPELPADLVFTKMELRVLRCHAVKKNYRPPTASAPQ